MAYLKIVMKNGEVKKYPIHDLDHKYTEGFLKVWSVNPKNDFFFFAPMQNIEYFERVKEP